MSTPSFVRNVPPKSAPEATKDAEPLPLTKPKNKPKLVTSLPCPKEDPK